MLRRISFSTLILASSLLSCGTKVAVIDTASRNKVIHHRDYEVHQISIETFEKFEVEADFRILEDYRQNDDGWIGFLVNTTSPKAIHGTHPGYLCFVRYNGNVGMATSVQHEVKKEKSTGLDFSKVHHLKVRFDGGLLSMSVDGVPMLEAGVELITSGNLTINAGGVRAEISNVRVSRLD